MYQNSFLEIICFVKDTHASFVTAKKMRSADLRESLLQHSHVEFTPDLPEFIEPPDSDEKSKCKIVRKFMLGLFQAVDFVDDEVW